MLLHFWVSEKKGARIYFAASPPVQKVWHPSLVWVWGYLVVGGVSFRSWSLKANLDLFHLDYSHVVTWPPDFTSGPLGLPFYWPILITQIFKIQFTKNTDFVGLNLKKFQTHSGNFFCNFFGQNLNLLVNFSIWKIKRFLISVQNPKC